MFDYRQEYSKYKKVYFAGLKNLAKRPVTRSSLGLILFLLTASLLILFALKPTLITIGGLWKEIKDKKEIDQKLGQKIMALEQAQAIFPKAEELMPLVDKALPNGADFSRLEKELEFLIFKNNLILVDVRFEKFNLFGTTPEEKEEKKTTKTTPKETELAFKLDLAGSYQDLKNFLKDLEDLDRIMITEKIIFSKETKVSGTELQINLTGRVSYLEGNILN